MNKEGVKRKLTAIFSADVKGYSRLMRENEVATVDTLRAYRKTMSALIQKHRGRVVDTPGDNVLAEFGSVVDAVQCAVEVQQELKARNAELPENRRMEFRIGVNLGDVIEEEERIYGDGVNVAARVEGLADAGGICISGTAFDQVRTKLSVGYEYLGEQTVKNIPEPVRVYRVLMEPEAAGKVIGEKRPGLTRGQRVALAAALVVVVAALAIWYFHFRPSPMEVASEEKMAFPLPDKPSIAVLPFTNMSGDPEQEYFSDGLTEEIITTLSKVSDLFVIARNSTFTYKGKPVKVKQVAEELGVRYVLEGSVRKAEDRVRITAQLIDALTGHHLWAERYDRELKDIFAVQDEITKKVVTALDVELVAGEQARMWARGTDSGEAWAYAAKAFRLQRRIKKEDNAKSQDLLERAIKLDPEYGFLWTLLAHAHYFDARWGWSKSRTESFKRAVECVKKALTINEEDPFAHALLGTFCLFQRKHERAIAECERAVAIDPNYADGYCYLAQALHYSGRFEDSLAQIKKAIRLCPIPFTTHLIFLAVNNQMLGRYEEAIPVFEKLLELSRKGESPAWLGHEGLIRSYIELGREEEARAHAEELLRVEPTYFFGRKRKSAPYKDLAHLERILSPLRKVGLPENPPLPLPDKPSIAVLPFTNMSEDPKQEYFSDGITEEIITALSKVSHLFVIARNSTFIYKGKSVKVQQVGRELGVRYVLEGSVRKFGDRVRVTGQLVDATTGHHLWAERYDRDLKDIFALQDEITKKIITAMQVKLTLGELANVCAKGTKNLEAYLKLLQGREHKYRLTKEDNALARQMLEEAIALDPEYAMAYRFLAGTHLMDVWFRSTKSPQQSLERAIELAQKAIALDDSLAGAYGLLGQLYTMKRQHEKGIAEAERAVALNPNSADAHASLGQSLHYAGRHEEAIRIYEKAIRLNPIPPNSYLLFLGHSYRAMGRYEEAITQYKEALHRRPNNLFAHIGLAAAYSLSGREEEARVATGEVLRIQPSFSLEYFAKQIPFKNQADKDRYVGALRKAGLK